MVHQVNDQGLEQQVLEARGLVVIGFFEYRSIPCRHFGPEFEAAAEALEDKIGFYRIDAVENPTITEELGVEAVPTLLVFRDGEEVARYEGPYSREAIQSRLNELISGTSTPS